MSELTFDLSCDVEWDPEAIRACGGEIPPFPDRHVQTLVAVAIYEAGAEQGERIEASVSFVTPERIAELNVEHREVDRPTDVLSFPMDGLVEDVFPPGSPRQLGDVVICPAYVVGQLERGETMKPHGPGQEEGDATLDAALERCIVHGVLHLAGFDHELGDVAAREMFALEQLVLDTARA
jgi:probable rRNA maturation factor